MVENINISIWRSTKTTCRGGTVTRLGVVAARIGIVAGVVYGHSRVASMDWLPKNMSRVS